MKRFVLAVFALVLSCSGPQVTTLPDGAVIVTPATWVSTVETAVSILNTALPGISATVAVLPIDPQAKIAAQAAVSAAEAAIPPLSAALASYAANPNTANRCAARAAVGLVTQTVLAVADGLGAIGFATPALVLLAVGGLGTVIDELLPACSSVVDASSPGPTAHTIADHLAGLPAGLRPLPVTR